MIPLRIKRITGSAAAFLVLLAGFASAGAPLPSYQFYRFTPTALKGGGGAVQISEFEMRVGGAPVAGATAANAAGTSPGGEGPELAVDGDTNTKWLNFDGAGGAILVLDFGAPTAVDGYRFATANDFPERDPVSWTIEGSNSAFGTYVLLDTVVGYPTTDDRFTYEQEFLLARPRINDFSTTTQIVTNGSTADLDYDTVNADTLTIDPGAVMATPDIGAAMVTPPADADTVYTLTADSAASGSAQETLTVRSVTAGTATYRYVRFSQVRLRDALPNQPGANSIQIADFQFFNGMTEVIPVSATDNGSSPAAEGPEFLLDANSGTKWLNFDRSPVVFDLGAPTLFDGYSFTTANDAPERDPIAWILEGSDDQVCWVALDNVSVQQGDPAQEYNFLPPLARQTPTQLIPLPSTAATPDPEIALFGAFPQIVPSGDMVTLLWETAFACVLEIDQGVGMVSGDTGNTIVTPPSNADTIYTLTAENPVGAMTTFPGPVRTVGQGSATYELIRFTPLRLAETLPFFGGAAGVQIAEFQLFNGGVALDLTPTGLNPFIDNPNGNSPIPEENAAAAFDGDPNTKWLDTNKGALVIDFGASNAQTFDAYSWVIANDAPERDVVAWRLEGSNDGFTWELIDNVDQNRDGVSGDIAFYYGLPRGQVVPEIPVPDSASLPPLIQLFAGDAPRLFPGDDLILTWETVNATTVTLDDGTGPVVVAASGSQALMPVADTSYTLTATNGSGPVTSQFTTTLVTSGVDVICYENFNSAGDELNLLGAAALLDDSANVPEPGSFFRLRLNPDAGGVEGSAWFAKRINFAGGFQTFFDLHFLAGSNAGADGISFMIQNTPEGNGAEPSGFNEDGLPANSLNIKFDSFQNAGEPSAAIIEVRDGTNVIATADLTTIPGVILAGSTPNDLSSDDFTVAPYQVQVDYNAADSDLDVYLDGILVIDSAFVDLSFIGAVDGTGTGYAGFSARTGGEFESHDITRWVLIPGTPAPPLKVTDFDLDTATDLVTITFASSDSRTYKITESVDGMTFTDFQTGISGGPGSTTVGPASFSDTGLRLFRVEEETVTK